MTASLDVIKNSMDNKNYPFEIIILDSSWSKKVFEFDQICYKELTKKSLYFPLEYEVIENMLNGDGFILGVIAENALVGFNAVSFDYNFSKTLGTMLNFTDDQIQHLAIIDATMIKSCYQGNGLQRVLFKKSIETLREYGGFKHIASTVSPHNLACISTMLSLDFHICKMVKIYDNSLRFISKLDL